MWNVLDVCKLNRVFYVPCAIQNSCTEIWMKHARGDTGEENLPEMT